MACQPQRQHHKGRVEWYEGHPRSLWVREDVLLDAVHRFFADRIFGPNRQTHLRVQLQRSAEQRVETGATGRRERLGRELAGLQRRQANLIGELENFEPTGDTDADRDYRRSIQRRFAELSAEQRTKQAELDHLATSAPHDDGDADLLDYIPQLPYGCTKLPEELERRLFDAFRLQIRYDRARHEASSR